ncbi:MAG: IS1380 family transposase [Candidatus Binatia bacterium]
MKSSKAQTHAKVHRVPDLKFEEETRLTSYSGLVIFFVLFRALDLRRRLRRCFAHLGGQKVVGYWKVMLLLVVHLLLGFRRLRGLDYYRDDPLVARVVGLHRLPDVSTVSRTLKDMDDKAVSNVGGLSRDIVLDRLVAENFARVTLDFDGSVQSTTGHMEGTAVGFNKVKKGARSYYPLYCTVAQTAQFFDMHHRPGNVHDSVGAPKFMEQCFEAVCRHLPRTIMEARADSAFFSETILDTLVEWLVEFTCSVPFNRFPELKAVVESIESWGNWTRLNDDISYSELVWKPKSWEVGKLHRYVAVRQRKPKQTKGPLQLDLFEPKDYDYEYKVIVTNKEQSAGAVIAFHNGRGSQEGIFAEGKQDAALGVIATRRKLGNQLFTFAGMLAHNLTRELQMRVESPPRATQPKRPARWPFLELGTIRQRLLQRAGRLSEPQGRLTLTLGANASVQAELRSLIEAAGASHNERAA